MQKNDSKNPEMVQKFAVQRNADLKPCRARKMLKNAPTLAIGGADTAENEPPKVRQVSNKIRRNIGAAALDESRVRVHRRRHRQADANGGEEVPAD